MKIEFSKLNPLEKRIYQNIEPIIKENPTISITELCAREQVSASKLSKFAKKCGFANFKQLKRYIAGEEMTEIQTTASAELQRVADYLAHFDQKVVAQFFAQIEHCKKLVILGYGPSYHCAEYFAYRLRTISNIFVIATHEEAIVENSASSDATLLVLSTTGQFKSFATLTNHLKYKNIVFLFEEFRRFPELNQHTVFYLTDKAGNPNLQPYEKARTLFFIFLEEVVQMMLNHPNALKNSASKG